MLDTCHKSFSTGREIISRLIEKNKSVFKIEPLVLGMPDTPTPTSYSLTKNYYPSKKSIAKCISKMLNIKKSI